MNFLSFRFIAILFIAVSSTGMHRLQAQSQTNLEKVTGTKVSLAPPAMFKPSGQFPGFGHEETGSSILVTELPAPYSKITEGFTKEGLATRGMTLINRREISLSGRPAILLHLRQIAQSTAFLKWMVATGTENETVLITATFPEELKTRFTSVLEKAVLSASWDAEAKTDPLAGLNFAIQDDPALKFAKRVSNMMLLTKDGTLPGKPTNDPLLVVGSSLSQAIIPDVKKFAEQRLMEIAQVTGIAIKKQSDVTIAGLPGSEIIADAEWKDRQQGRVLVYQVLLVDEKNYFIIQGFAPREEQQKYLEIFQRITKSFRKK